jgi:hypothetical protein
MFYGARRCHCQLPAGAWWQPTSSARSVRVIRDGVTLPPVSELMSVRDFQRREVALSRGFEAKRCSKARDDSGSRRSSPPTRDRYSSLPAGAGRARRL